MSLERDVDLDKLAEITDRHAGVDIVGICMKAGLFALHENTEAKKVTMEHFYRAVKEAIPSVTEEMEKEYDKLAQKVKQ
ncbi:MAG: AAA family ATPase, partial [Candidatus Binatia bacterium]|nr:AAA family ATPase [Candidatus Binatia bacterium]